jgi:methyltransferase (TIGR00027 family)
MLRDDAPKIFQDPLALGLSGVENESALQAILGAMPAAHARRSTPEVAEANYRCARASMVVRQRYAEEALDEAIERGVGHYVILGAGLDSFAYRRLDLAAVLRVFEVDHPATQQWKRARLRDLHVTPPSNLTFIPLDFEQHTLGDGLRAGGHRPDLPTLFSWLGVTQVWNLGPEQADARYCAGRTDGLRVYPHMHLMKARIGSIAS